MALNLNCITLDMSRQSTAVIETDSGIVIRCWVPYMGWYFAKVNPEYREPRESNPPGVTKYIPDGPCSVAPLLKLIDIID